MSFFYLKSISIFRNRYFFYILNFIILVILTIFPFFIVIKQMFSKEVTYFIIILCLIIQILIHIKLFFYLNFSDRDKWNTISIIFSLLIILIIFFGSFWVMKNLNHNMYNVIV